MQNPASSNFQAFQKTCFSKLIFKIFIKFYTNWDLADSHKTSTLIVFISFQGGGGSFEPPQPPPPPPPPLATGVPIHLSDSATRKAIKFGTEKNHENGSVSFLLNMFLHMEQTKVTGKPRG